MTLDPFPVKLPSEAADSPNQPTGAPSEPAPSRADNFFLNYLTENQNYGMVTYRWTKAPRTPTESGRSRLAGRKRRDKA
jgi:hypothetical protein